jgi:hypothetical protein
MKIDKYLSKIIRQACLFEGLNQKYSTKERQTCEARQKAAHGYSHFPHANGELLREPAYGCLPSRNV